MADEPQPPTDDEVAASVKDAIRKLTGDAPPPGTAPDTLVPAPPPDRDEA